LPSANAITNTFWAVCVITADYHRLPQTNISSQQANSTWWESYLEDCKLPQTNNTADQFMCGNLENGKLPQTTFYLPQTN